MLMAPGFTLGGGGWRMCEMRVSGYSCRCQEDGSGRNEIRDGEITEFLNRIYQQEKRGSGLERLGWNPIKCVSDLVGMQVSWLVTGWVVGTRAEIRKPRGADLERGVRFWTCWTVSVGGHWVKREGPPTLGPASFQPRPQKPCRRLGQQGGDPPANALMGSCLE